MDTPYWLSRIKQRRLKECRPHAQFSIGVRRAIRSDAPIPVPASLMAFEQKGLLESHWKIDFYQVDLPAIDNYEATPMKNSLSYGACHVQKNTCSNRRIRAL
jgi:hypothetical protein